MPLTDGDAKHSRTPLKSTGAIEASKSSDRNLVGVQRHPLTTTVMGAVDSHRAGVASGINNTVARVAGLLAIAVFGVLLARRFDTEVKPRLEQLALPPAIAMEVAKELPKMAGAEVKNLAIDARQRLAVRQAVDEAFVSGFHLVIIGAAILALAAGTFGAAIRQRATGSG